MLAGLVVGGGGQTASVTMANGIASRMLWVMGGMR